MKKKKKLSILIFVLGFAVIYLGQEMPPLVLQKKGMEKVIIKQMIFKKVEEQNLRTDIYYPPDFDFKSTLPVVVFHNCSGIGLPDWQNYQDWAKLIALSGIIAVNYQSRPFVKEDSEDLIDYLHQKAKDIRININCIGIWTSSGNAMIGVPLMLQTSRKYIRCGVVYYGMPDDITPLKPLRQDISLFIARAGLDEFRANRNIDRFIEAALNADLDFQLVNYPEGHHGFDVLDNTETSKAIIQQTLTFFKDKLLKPKQESTDSVLTVKKFYSLMFEGKIESAITIFHKARERYQKDQFYRAFIERSLSLMGRDLLNNQKIPAAIETFKLSVGIYPQSIEACNNLAEAYEIKGDHQHALNYSKKALDLLDKNNKKNSDQKDQLRKNILKRIRRLTENKNQKGDNHEAT